MNLVAIAIGLFSLAQLVLRRRRGVSIPWSAWLGLGLWFGVDRVYVPIGPILVLLVLYFPVRQRVEPRDTA
mgnify:CR=1 FL=1